MVTPYDVIIAGGGPAGAAAAVYAARKRLKTLLVTDEWGGQSTVSPDIHNWIGDITVSGADLAKKLRTHVESYQGDSLAIEYPLRAQSLITFPDHIELTLSNGAIRHARALLIATGSKRRKLEAPGAAQFDQKGLTYCASCDGPLFADQDVAVVGGGNAAFETAMQLLSYCKSVTLLNRSDSFRADEVTVEKVLRHPKMRVLRNVAIKAVMGDKFVSGITYVDASGTETLLPVAGIFVEIGLIPNTEWVTSPDIKQNEIRQIVVDPRTQRSSHPRVWAAGDCTDGIYHQNNIAVGDAVKALEDLYLFVHQDTAHS